MNEQGEIDTLKVVNIIFAEHQKLSVENPLLREKIKTLEELNQSYVESDSLYKESITHLSDSITFKNNKITKLKKKQKRLKIGASISIVVSFLIGLLV